MLRVPLVGYRDGLAVPAGPISGFVSGDEEDRFAGGIEGEQHPDLAAAGRWRPQFFHVVKLAALDPIDQGPSEARALFNELVNGIRDPICRARVVATETEEPSLDIRVKTYLPAHSAIITYLSCAAQARRLALRAHQAII